VNPGSGRSSARFRDLREALDDGLVPHAAHSVSVEISPATALRARSRNERSLARDRPAARKMLRVNLFVIVIGDRVAVLRVEDVAGRPVAGVRGLVDRASAISEPQRRAPPGRTPRHPLNYPQRARPGGIT
jgi:hypothetical protein